MIISHCFSLILNNYVSKKMIYHNFFSDKSVKSDSNHYVEGIRSYYNRNFLTFWKGELLSEKQILITFLYLQFTMWVIPFKEIADPGVSTLLRKISIRYQRIDKSRYCEIIMLFLDTLYFFLMTHTVTKWLFCTHGPYMICQSLNWFFNMLFGFLLILHIFNKKITNSSNF